ncbi:MAG TPA: hypothetical protein GX498_06575 [Clostridiales bacterium]|nr:hypothetical protein [Clostridiales bacterium]
MQEPGYIRKFFLGANTYKGFHSFYEYVVPGTPNKLFILKGGPGTGKSTFLRKVANEFAKMGYDVEIHHCSSDNDSLDGVRIVQLNVAIMDGTAPHTTDPKYPAAVDEIINLGEYWNKEKIEKNRETIISYNKELKKLYASSYRFLRAAKEVQDDLETLIGDQYDWVGFNNTLLEYKSTVLDPVKPLNKLGKPRHLFHSSINSAGRVDYIEDALLKECRCHYIKTQYCTAATEFLKALSSDLLMKGYDVEIFHKPLDPNIIETIMVNELSLAISNDQKLVKKADRIIDLEKHRDINSTEKYHSSIINTYKIFENLLDEAIKRIQEAKKLHDNLEKFYAQNMDFERIAKLRSNTIERIKKMIK